MCFYFFFFFGLSTWILGSWEFCAYVICVLIFCFGGWWSGVDPKSILCEFFKAGQCTKGFKCKFSHDLNVQRKGEKIDIYSDKRDQGEEFCLPTMQIYHHVGGNISVVIIVIKLSLLGVETMEDWDQETLEKVVESKKTEYNPNKPTEIVCLLYSILSLSFSIFCVVDLYVLLFVYLFILRLCFCSDSHKQDASIPVSKVCNF